MKITIRVLSAAAMLALAGCYAKLDDSSVAITDTISAPGLPPTDYPSVTVAQVTFDIGDITVDASSQDSSLTTNSVALTLINPGSATTFAGIRAASVVVVPPSSRTDLKQETIATYDSARDGQAGTTLTLKGVSSVNLVPYLTDKTLVLTLTGSGVPPGPAGITWVADLAVDFHVVAQKNIP